jgi:hypothetical protein
MADKLERQPVHDRHITLSVLTVEENIDLLRRIEQLQADNARLTAALTAANGLPVPTQAAGQGDPAASSPPGSAADLPPDSWPADHLASWALALIENADRCMGHDLMSAFHRKFAPEAAVEWAEARDKWRAAFQEYAAALAAHAAAVAERGTP